MTCAVVGGKVPLGVGGLQLLVCFLKLRLLDGQVQNDNSHDHDHRDDEEQRAVADVFHALRFGRRVQHGGQPQVQDAADRAHQVDDGVCAAAQRLGGDVGHQGHSRGAVGAHGHQQQAQHHDKQH